MFKILGYKINIEIWKNTDNKILILDNSNYEFREQYGTFHDMGLSSNNWKFWK